MRGRDLLMASGEPREQEPGSAASACSPGGAQRGRNPASALRAEPWWCAGGTGSSATAPLRTEVPLPRRRAAPT